MTAGSAAIDDGLLVRRAQGGDVAAFEALYRLHVGRIHALCRRLAGNADEAEEMVQEAFVLAWRKLASFRGESAFGSWLYRLALNAALSHRRSHRRQQPHWLPLDDGTSTTSADDRLPRRELATSTPSAAGLGVDLERAIAGLPEGARAVFVLADVYGHAHDEISRLLEIAVGTSKAQLHRARLLLRKALTQ